VAYNENELPIATTFSSGSKAAKFKGSECACLLSFYPEEKDKILLLTQYAHTRVLESSKIAPGKRLGPFTEVFRSFKSVTIFSAVLSVFCALAGLLISIVAGTPVGSTIVAADIAAFLICSVLARLLGRSVS
jgi:hypothetical protein